PLLPPLFPYTTLFRSSRFWRKAHEVWGLATGWGLDHNIKEAYRFLVENYDSGKRSGSETAERDRIYIFGFSRGAYSARVLAGFIDRKSTRLNSSHVKI